MKRKKRPHRLTNAIRRLLHQPAVACSSAQKHTASTALLSLLLLNQPGLVEAQQVQAKFVEVKRLDNPLTPPIDVGDAAKPAFADIDNDGDFDVFIGTLAGTVKYYENTGNVNHPIFEERTDENNPLNEVNIESDSPILVDIDNDDDLDVFIGGKNSKEIKYYENTGDANQPIFEQRTEEKNPLNRINESAGILPFFVDIDNDSDLDVFIGTGETVSDDDKNQISTFNGIVKYFENIGNINVPIFEERPETTYPFSRRDNSGTYVPYFVDIDNDGDMDAFIGTARYYENTGTAKQPNFTEQTIQNNPLNDINVDTTPVLIDINGDSDLDVFIGASDGTVKYYENIGTSNEAQFVERTKLDNPFGGGMVDNDISLTLADIDNDGDFDAFTVKFNGVKYYENTGNLKEPSFVERIDNPLQPIKEIGSGIPFALVDIDNDGDLDIFTGEQRGVYIDVLTGMEVSFFEVVKILDGHFEFMDGNFDTKTYITKYYENTGSASQPNFEERINDMNPLGNANISATNNHKLSSFQFIDIDGDRDFDVFLDSDYYENTGSINHPVFVKRLNQNNPLKNMDVGDGNTLTLIDVDNDGNLEVFVRTSEGKVKYYEIRGSIHEPHLEERKEQNNPFVDVTDIDKNSIPILVDLDNDGDLDAFIKSSSGMVKYYQNISDINQPVFVLKQNNLFAESKGSFKPTLVDIDKDNDLDAFIGTIYGTVRYYENIGIVNQPIFVEQTEQNNPLVDVETGPFVRLTLVDIDGDDDLDAFIGGKEDTVSYYENIGSVTQPSFVERTNLKNPLYNIKVEGFSPILSDVDKVEVFSPILGDIDNDGDLDAFICEQRYYVVTFTCEIIHYYKNIGTSNQSEFVDYTEQNKLLADIKNLESFRPFTLVLVDADNDNDLDVVVAQDDSTVIYYENMGNVDDQPSFIRQGTIEDYTLANVLKSNPSLADIDNDGDLDALVNASDDINYYENISLAGNALPSPYALPKNGVYTSKREISLNCIDCEKIYYTLDGTTETISAVEYTGPFEITANATINFAAIDAQGNLSKVRTEQYVIDTHRPKIKITSPKNNKNIDSVVSIEGTVFEAEGETGLDRIELQMTDNTFYLTGDKDTPYERSLTWIPIEFYDNNWSYDIDAAIIPSGKYSITVRAFDKAGNVGEDTITVRIGLAFTTLSINLNSSAILQDKPVELTGKLYRWPALETDFSDLPIILTITPPTGDSWQEQTVTNQLGEYKFDVSSFAHKGTYQLQVTFAGNEKLESSKSKINELSVGTSAGYAILIQGRVNNEEGLKPHHKTLERVYKQLKERNFKDENILSFNHNKANQTFNYEPNQINTDNEYKPSKSSIQVAIENWAKDRLIGSPAPLYIIMVDHGDWEQFILNGTEDVITPEELDTWLDTLENSLADSPLNPLEEPRVIIIGACFSGSFIPSLSRPDRNRVIITSARESEFSYKGPQEADGIRSGEYFIDALFQQLGRGEPFKLAFEKATNSTELFTYSGAQDFVNNINNPELLDQAVQHPLLDDNGDDKGSNVLYANTGDGQKIDKRRLGVGLDYNANAVGNPAAVKAMTETQYLESNETSALLWLKATGNVGISIMEIRRPVVIDTITHQSRITEQVELDLPKRFPTFNRNTANYEYTYQNFDEPGRYQIFYYVHAQAILDPETGDIISLGDISPVKHSIVYKDKEGNKAPEASTLLYPPDGASTRTDLGFYGEIANDPNGAPVTYTLLIATNNDDLDDSVFDNSVVYKQEELRIPTTYIDRNTIINDGRADGTTGLKDLTTYYWKFEAIDNFGARTSSEIFSFETDNATNGIPRPNPCDGTLSTLQVVAKVVYAQIKYTGALQATCGIYKVVGEVKSHTSKPNDKVTAYYDPITRQLDIIDRNIRMQQISDNPLQFKRIN